MPQWTSKRASKCVRNSDGTFRKWIGGKTKSQLHKQENNYQGIAIHIGKEFKRQHGRPAKVGEMVRFKIKSGAYHKQAFWYIRTENGWRKSVTETRKPTVAEIRKQSMKSRKGR